MWTVCAGHRTSLPSSGAGGGRGRANECCKVNCNHLASLFHLKIPLHYKLDLSDRSLVVRVNTLVPPLAYIGIMFSAPCLTFSSMLSCRWRAAMRCWLADVRLSDPGDWGSSGVRVGWGIISSFWRSGWQHNSDIQVISHVKTVPLWNSHHVITSTYSYFFLHKGLKEMMVI